MESLFTNFQMDNTFYIAIGLFLLITILISTIIVLFMSRISKLEAILEHAKVVDNTKEERMGEFYEVFQEERTKNMGLEKELECFSESKEKIKEYELRIERLKERMIVDSKEHFKVIHEQKKSLEELNTHYELLGQSFYKQEESHKLLVKRNEDLVNLSNSLHLKIRETQIELSKEKKQNHERASQKNFHN